MKTNQTSHASVAKEASIPSNERSVAQKPVVATLGKATALIQGVSGKTDEGQYNTKTH